jgi:hypothetical protein
MVGNEIQQIKRAFPLLSPVDVVRYASFTNIENQVTTFQLSCIGEEHAVRQWLSLSIEILFYAFFFQ